MIFFATPAGKALITFLISMVPVIELRGAIPYGIAAGLDPWIAFALSIVGNMLPVPFILLFIRKILGWMKRFPSLARIAERLEKRADHKSGRVQKSELIGLCVLAVDRDVLALFEAAFLEAIDKGFDAKVTHGNTTISLDGDGDGEINA